MTSSESVTTVECIGSNNAIHTLDNILGKNVSFSDLAPGTFYTCCIRVPNSDDNNKCKSQTAPIITKIETPPSSVKDVNITAQVRSSKLEIRVPNSDDNNKCK